MIAACEGLELDAACDFTPGDHDLSGTCRATSDGTVACTPALPRGCHLGRGGRHGRGGRGWGHGDR
jgi:hypothetical protein